jgi:hypothetical protein
MPASRSVAGRAEQARSKLYAGDAKRRRASGASPLQTLYANPPHPPGQSCKLYANPPHNPAQRWDVSQAQKVKRPTEMGRFTFCACPPHPPAQRWGACWVAESSSDALFGRMETCWFAESSAHAVFCSPHLCAGGCGGHDEKHNSPHLCAGGCGGQAQKIGRFNGLAPLARRRFASPGKVQLASPGKIPTREKKFQFDTIPAPLAWRRFASPGKIQQARSARPATLQNLIKNPVPNEPRR